MSLENKNTSSSVANPLASLTDETLLNCMQCGFCLPHCPTYSLEPLEKYSPRGRIQLTRILYEQSSGITSENHLDGIRSELKMQNETSESIHSCLGCFACQTACPAGVDYESIFESAKNLLQKEGMKKNEPKAMLISLGLKIIATPRLLSALSKILFILQKTALTRHLPESLERFWILSPIFAEYPFHKERLRGLRKNQHQKKVRLLTGCIMNYAFLQEHRATVQLLDSLGFEVITEAESNCCGALHAHNGFSNDGDLLAREILFQKKESAPLIVNSAGCGAWLKHRREFINQSSKQHSFVASTTQVYDLAEFLFKENFFPSLPKRTVRIAYQDACHLEHGQKIKNEPRELLSRVFEDVLELASPECCGSAGIYNLTEPNRSELLLERKIEAIQKLKLDYVVSSNPGCLLQLRYGIQKSGLKTKAIHIAEALAMGISENK